MNLYNKKLFPEELISGCVQSQEDLGAMFMRYPNFSKTYVQTATHWKEYRDWYEKQWPHVYKYLDKDFLNRFKTEAEHDARAWEFHIAAVLSEHGIKLEEKTWDYGPDFCIKLSNGKNLWIEAVVCNRGVIDPVDPLPEMEPEVLYSFSGSVEDTHRPRALRITNAIGAKFEKFKDYLLDSKKSNVKEEDCLVVAVNGQLIQHYARADMLFKRSVFAQGPYAFTKVPGKNKLQGPYFKPAPTISKKVGDKESDIPANFMEMDEFSKISAVLYCGHSASHSWNNGYSVGDDFIFGYHVNADNPISDSFFKFGRGVRKNVAENSITDFGQSPKV